MRTILLALGAFTTAVVMNSQPADAREKDYPWCAEMSDFATECTFLSVDEPEPSCPIFVHSSPPKVGVGLWQVSIQNMITN